MTYCAYEGCQEKAKIRGYCNKHYCKMRYYGLLEMKGKQGPNEIVFYNDIVELIITAKLGKEKCRAIIDREDYDKIKDHRWFENGDGYVCTNKEGTIVTLHRMLAPEYKMIDHKDQNKLNNRKQNLRPCNLIQNGQNRKVQKNNISGVPGVGYRKSDNKWQARIWVNRKMINLGLYNNFQDAIKARQNAEINYFKEFNPLRRIYA